MPVERPSQLNKNLDNNDDNTQANRKKTFPQTTNQWYGRQKLLPYETGGPMIKRLPYVKERLIGCWGVD